MKRILFTSFLLLGFLLYGQKIEEQTITDYTIKSIVVEGDAIFKIEINTSNAKSIKIKSRIEGEYSKHTKIKSEINNGTLSITCDYPKLTNRTDDKLNAHKVHSIDININIPKYLNVYIKSAIASAKISGAFKNLLLELNQGNAQVLNFTGNGIINTMNGNINLETNNAVIKAKTRTGIIKKEKIEESKNQIEITSINGNINVYKTKN